MPVGTSIETEYQGRSTPMKITAPQHAVSNAALFWSIGSSAVSSRTTSG